MIFDIISFASLEANDIKFINIGLDFEKFEQIFYLLKFFYNGFSSMFPAPAMKIGKIIVPAAYESGPMLQDPMLQASTYKMF